MPSDSGGANFLREALEAGRAAHRRTREKATVGSR